MGPQGVQCRGKTQRAGAGPARCTNTQATRATATLQKLMPMTKGWVVPSMWAPTQRPDAKATTIIRKPANADAAPAALGNGAIAPLCPQGW